MPRVLVIDDDVGTLLGYKGMLRTAGHDVTTAALGEDGLGIAENDRFDVVLCDQRLPDGPGTDIVRRIHGNCPHTAIVLVTAWSTPELIIEARRAGATSFAAKPLVGDDLLSVVDEALRLHREQPAAEPDLVGHAARRWADLVVRGAYLVDDPKTVPLWCRAIGVAHGTLKNRCETVRVTPKESLDFSRLLRVVIHHTGEPWDLQRWLDIVDDRTVEALMHRSGLSPACLSVPSIDVFLPAQQLICRSDLIEALRARLLRVLSH